MGSATRTDSETPICSPPHTRADLQRNYNRRANLFYSPKINGKDISATQLFINAIAYSEKSRKNAILAILKPIAK